MAAVRDLSTSEALFKSHRFLNKFNLSTLSTSNVSDEWRSRSRLHDHGGLSSSRGLMKYHVEQLNKIGVPATAIVIEEQAEKNREMRDCV